MMSKNRVFYILGALCIIAGVAFLWPGSKDSADLSAQPSAPQAVPVSILEMARQNTRFKHQLPGRITPYRQSQVRPQVDGIITKRLFEEGADVKKGQQLYQIDDARYRAVYHSAVADLQSAKSNVQAIKAKEQRYRDLVKIDAVSQQEYDNVKAELDQANAAIAVAQSTVDLAKVDLDYTKVYAPIAGRIGKSLATEGALVTANQSQHLAVITQLDPVFIDIQQSGIEAITLRSYIAEKADIPVSITMGEGNGQDYPHRGTLKFSEVTIDETSGSISLRAQMPNPDGVLLTGLFVTAVLDLGEFDLLLVPQRATIRKPDGSLVVWVVDADRKAQPRTITAKYEYNNNWIVRSGLNAGDQVIIEGYQKLQPGMPVSPSDWIKPGEAQANQDA